MKIRNFDEYLRNRILESNHVSLFESIETDAQEISQELDLDGQEDPDKLAAALSKLIDANGDLEKVDLEEIVENYKAISQQELNEEHELNENEGGIIYVLEVLGTVLGNADLMHFISDVISKKLGKKVDVSKAAAFLKSIVDIVKKATGYPAKVFKKFFEWVAKILGLDKTGQRIMGLASLGVATVIMLVVGIAFFPAAAAISGVTGLLSVILSTTALVGKVAEITVIGQEIIKIVHTQLKAELKGEEPSEEEMTKALSSMTLEI